MKNLKKYILFDNDGVLVETEKWYFEANKKALKELGLTLHMDTYQEIMARGGTAWEVAIAQGIETSIIDKKRVQRDIYYQDFLQTKNLEIPKVKKVLADLSKKYKITECRIKQIEDREIRLLRYPSKQLRKYI